MLSPSSSASADLNAPLILIVEDDETNGTALSLYLQAKGYRFAIARHGQEAWELAHTQHPDLILMDIQMPVLDGMEATQRLRAATDPAVASIPVIALTALVMPGDRERCLAVGANEYIAKPVNLKYLVGLIQRLTAH